MLVHLLLARLVPRLRLWPGKRPHSSRSPRRAFSGCTCFDIKGIQWCSSFAPSVQHLGRVPIHTMVSIHTMVPIHTMVSIHLHPTLLCRWRSSRRITSRGICGRPSTAARCCPSGESPGCEPHAGQARRQLWVGAASSRACRLLHRVTASVSTAFATSRLAGTVQEMVVSINCAGTRPAGARRRQQLNNFAGFNNRSVPISSVFWGRLLQVPAPGRHDVSGRRQWRRHAAAAAAAAAGGGAAGWAAGQPRRRRRRQGGFVGRQPPHHARRCVTKRRTAASA